MKFKNLTIEDIIGELPKIKKLTSKNAFQKMQFDFYIQSIGFEERTCTISQELSTINSFKVDETLLLKYTSNIEDNKFYEDTVMNSVKKFSHIVSQIQIKDEYIREVSERIMSKTKSKNKTTVIIDISTLSSHVILSLVNELFNLNVDLNILYTEGLIYHPTIEEYEQFGVNDFHQTTGIEKISISPEFTGGEKEKQDLVICFPSFKAERTEAIITHINDLILKENKLDRIIWIIGNPHMDEPIKTKRKQIQKDIHKLDNKSKIYEVCTLDYKDTIIALEHIYENLVSQYHLNISDLGSKMQSIGIAIFALLRRDISVYYSQPKKYNSSHYSEKSKDIWHIEIGSTNHFMKTLYKVDTIEAEIN